MSPEYKCVKKSHLVVDEGNPLTTFFITENTGRHKTSESSVLSKETQWWGYLRSLLLHSGRLLGWTAVILAFISSPDFPFLPVSSSNRTPCVKLFPTNVFKTHDSGLAHQRKTSSWPQWLITSGTDSHLGQGRQSTSPNRDFARIIRKETLSMHC